MDLTQVSIHAWLLEHDIKTEKGLPLSFKDHLFLFHPYADLTPKQVYLKAAQIGLSTLQIVKTMYVAKMYNLNVIYTLPTDGDVQDFAGGKVNPIIDQNPILGQYVKDHDTVEQKRVGNSTIYYRGTFTQKTAIMVSSDMNVYDEVDSSNQSVIEQYASRLQASKYKWEWYFSHPSTQGTGVDRVWQVSDQKHWFIKCGACNYEQFIAWPQSIDPVRKVYQCKECKAEITDDMRRHGRWVKKYKDREVSGYWIPLLICPWVPASEILEKYHEKSDEYFYNKVLGLPFVGGGNKLTKQLCLQNLTDDLITPKGDERVVIGMDTGKKLHYVCGTSRGLFYYGVASDYDEIERLMNRWPKAILVIDQGGDLIGSRKMREQYKGRVFLCSYGSDRKTKELVRWGKNDEDGAVIVDRNRMIQLVVDEFIDKRIPLQGNENDWYDYWLHWNNLTRVTEENSRGMLTKVWVRNGDDHWAHATAYWRTGMSRFSNSKGSVIGATPGPFANIKESPTVAPDGSISAPDPKKLFTYAEQKDEHDWRT